MTLQSARGLKPWHENNLFRRFFDFIRVHLCPFAVQICFPFTLPKLLTTRPVLSSPTANSFLDSELLTSFGVETLRDPIEFQRNVPEHRNLPQPRVFISHQRRDKNRAVTISKLAKKMGFDYWLDVHDPALRLATLNPNPDPVQQSLIVAILVEMALLNCSHVLAIVTRHTAGSLWVPCEYGRVKSISMFCPFASSLISRRVFNGGAFAAVYTQTMSCFLFPYRWRYEPAEQNHCTVRNPDDIPLAPR